MWSKFILQYDNCQKKTSRLIKNSSIFSLEQGALQQTDPNRALNLTSQLLCNEQGKDINTV